MTSASIKTGDLLAVNLKNSRQIVFDVINESESCVLLAVSGLSEVVNSYWLPRSVILVDSCESENLHICHLSPSARNDMSVVAFVKQSLSLV